MAHAKGISIPFKGRDYGIICIEGTATSGDVGVTGKPIWDVAYEDSRKPEGDIKTLQLECGFGDLASAICNRLRVRIDID